MVWVARPNMVDAAFASWVWPLLAIVFSAFRHADVRDPLASRRLRGWDWFWVVLAGLLDLGHWTAGAASRRRAPGVPA